MSPQHDIETGERRRRERKIWRTGLLVSVALHLLIFFAWQGNVIPISPFAAAGPAAGDNRAASGSMQVLSMRVPPVVPIVPPLIPIPIEIEIEPVEVDPDSQMDPATFMGDAPGLEGPGKADGTGQGDGGNADEGFFRLQPASPRGMIIPPTHKSLRGRDVQVWVFVNELGRVVGDSTRLDPPTGDRGLNQQLIREASEWLFRPAVQEGKPVSSWFPYRISG